MTDRDRNDIRILAQHLLHAGVAPLSDRDRRLIVRIAKRMQTARNLNQEFEERLTFGNRLADKVAAIGGSWRFIVGFTLFLAGWAAINTIVLAEHAFDPYPYIFLNLLLSMLAALQAPIIMMSQNRQAEKDRLAAALDYEVNVKAEAAIAELHEKVDGLLARSDLPEGAANRPEVSTQSLREQVAPKSALAPLRSMAFGGAS